MAGWLGGTGKAALFDRSAAQRRMRGDSAVDHAHRAPGRGARVRGQCRIDRTERAASGLEYMVEIGGHPRRDLVEQLERRTDTDALGYCELNELQSELGFSTCANRAKTRSLRQLQRHRIRIDGDQHPTPDGITLVVPFEQGAILADQFLEAQSPEILERGRPRIHDALGENADAVERRLDGLPRR